MDIQVAKKKHKNLYLDNKVLYTVMLKWWTECQDARERDVEPPAMPDHVGKSIMAITNGMSMKYNFRNYPFLSEMVSDGIENGVQAAFSFNPNKSTNPFGYFSITIYNAFVRRIMKEKRILYGKYKLAQNMVVNTESEFHKEEVTQALSGVLDNPYMIGLADKIENGDPTKPKNTGMWRIKSQVPKK
jgi:hypothetical protein